MNTQLFSGGDKPLGELSAKRELCVCVSGGGESQEEGGGGKGRVILA